MSRQGVSALVLAAGLLVLSSPLLAQPWSSPRKIQEPAAAPGELIVLLVDGGGAPTAEEVVENHRRGLKLLVGAGVERPMEVKPALAHRAQGRTREEIEADADSPRARLERYLLLKFPEDADLDAIQAALERDSHVLHVERNFFLKLHVIPSDPLFPVAAQPINYQWGSHLLGFQGAWDYAKGHAYVGLVDTGLQVTHPDLRPFHTQGSTLVYDGGNFRAHLSFDLADEDADVDELGPDASGFPATSGGHGTHVSGIVAGTANNASGIAGGCWGCSILMAKATNNRTGSSVDVFLADVANSLTWLVDHGAQVVSMSLGVEGLTCAGATGNLGMLCTALDLAQRRDVLMAASSGNDKVDIDFPASDLRVMSIGGIESTGTIWDRADEGEGCPCNWSSRPNWLISRCNQGPATFECGSNYTATPGSAQQDLVAPARQVLSTFYENRAWNLPLGCHDTEVSGVNHAGVGYDLCTGTSMSSPHVASIAGILRSVNPLLSKAQIESALTGNASRAGNWDPKLGYGYPNASASVQAVLGRANGAVLPNRLTPLFSMYSPVGEDHFYTTVPQMGAAAYWSSPVYYYEIGPDAPDYGYFPGSGCQVSPCSAEPGASVYIFTTDRSPNGQLLVPLYRMTFEGTFPGGPNNLNNRDTTYTTEPAGVLAFKSGGYELDGIEGYIFKKCTPEPSCMPAGTVRLYRQYNAARDDFAIFPESELAFMQGEGYTSNGGNLNPVLGYVYPNADSDFDNVIDGFEGLIGTSPSRIDSDCDGISDGTEILGYPNTDPRIANSGPGCVPPVAHFTFTCSGLSCSFDSSGSTDNVGIVSRSWSFGGSNVTANYTFPTTGVYMVTLTVTDTHGLQSSMSKKVSVISPLVIPAENYFAVQQCRVVDTHNTNPLDSGQIRTFNIAGNCGIPATAKAVSFNVTVVSPTGNGNLVFYPGNQTSSPFVSSVINFNPGASPRANNAMLRLATDGAGTVAVLPSINAGSPPQVHLILDVDGYFSEDTVPPAGAQGPFGFQTLTPCRIADTRTTSPLTNGVTRDFAVQGLCGVPSDAIVGMLNLVAFQPSEGGQARMFQAGTPAPGMATNQFVTGTPALANGARTSLANPGGVSVQYSSQTPGTTMHAILDVYGYFKPGAPLKYRPITPCRAVDTRFADQGGPMLAANETRIFQIQGNCGVPVGAKAAMLNFVSFTPAGSGHLRAYPSGITLPLASVLNFSPSQGNVANGVIVPLSTNADDLAIFAGVSSTHVIIDVFGYFQ